MYVFWNYIPVLYRSFNTACNKVLFKTVCLLRIKISLYIQCCRNISLLLNLFVFFSLKKKECYSVSNSIYYFHTKNSIQHMGNTFLFFGGGVRGLYKSGFYTKWNILDRHFNIKFSEVLFKWNFENVVSRCRIFISYFFS